MLGKILTSATSAALTILYAGGFVTNSSAQNYTELIEPSTSVSVECDWYHPNMLNNTETTCDAFSIRHGMSSQSLNTFKERAEKCVLMNQVSCVLSHEVAVEVPGYYFHNAERVTLVVMPQLFSPKHFQTMSNVMVVNPNNKGYGSRTIVKMYDNVIVDYIDAHTHTNVKREIDGMEAYCAQMLVKSVPDDCSLNQL